MDDRVIVFEGIHNFRDYGGYAARDGARIKEGVLFRSGQHFNATPADLDRVASLNFATVIDLRGNTERMTNPCPRPSGFSAQVLFFDGETVTGGEQAPHIEAASQVNTADEALRAMTWIYTQIPFRPGIIAVYRQFFEALAGDPGPSLLHCMAGKDRTGIAAGLLHQLLGVHPDDVMADFLLTNQAGNIERRIAAGATSVRRHFGSNMDEAAVRTLMSVDPDYLNTAWRVIREAHGSVENYARDVLGVTPDQLRGIENNLLG